MLRLVRALRQLVRPTTTVLVLLQTLLCYGLLADAPPSPPRAVAAALLLALWYAHAVAVNDLSDVETDRINLATSPERASRPLLNQTLDVTLLRRLAWALAVAMVLVSAGVGWVAVPVTVLMAGLDCVYSLPPWRWSARGALAQLTLPLGYVAYPAVVAWVLAGQPSVDAAALVGVVGLAVLFCGRLFLKDVRDVEGDRATGKATYLVRHGLARTLRVAAGLMVAGVLLMALAVVPAAPVALGLSALATVVALLVTLPAVGRTRVLEEQLLRVGRVGRVASGWTFACTTAVLLDGVVADVDWWQRELLTALAAIAFATTLSPFPTAASAEEGEHRGDADGDGQVVQAAGAEQLHQGGRGGGGDGGQRPGDGQADQQTHPEQGQRATGGAAHQQPAQRPAPADHEGGGVGQGQHEHRGDEGRHLRSEGGGGHPETEDHLTPGPVGPRGQAAQRPAPTQQEQPDREPRPDEQEPPVVQEQAGQRHQHP